jgi:hypothetical protein
MVMKSPGSSVDNMGKSAAGRFRSPTRRHRSPSCGRTDSVRAGLPPGIRDGRARVSRDGTHRDEVRRESEMDSISD